MALTADELDAAVLRRCFWPSTNAPFTQTERLAIANEEIAGTLWPKVVAAQADYYQTILDQSITSGQQQYRLPMRTYGPIKDVTVVDSDGNEFSCSMIDAEELGQGVWVQRYYGQFSGGSCSYSFYVAGDWIHLRPIPNETANTLRVRYYRQPSSLVLTTAARQVVLIELSGTDGSDNLYNLTLNSGTTPSGWSTILGATTLWLDVINAGNAHQNLLAEVQVEEINEGTQAVIQLRTPSDLLGLLGAESDKSVQLDTPQGLTAWLALAGQSPVVQLPDFMQTPAIRSVAAALLEAHGDDRATYERAKADELIELAISTATPRVQGEPKFITTSNGPYRVGRAGWIR